MFSIARYTGEEDQEKDSRSLEKKQERLNKLNARISSKKRKEVDPPADASNTTTEKKSKTDIVEQQEKKKKSKSQPPVAETSKTQPIEEKEDDEEEEEETEKVTNETEETEQENDETESMEVDPPVMEQEKDVPTLEAFPDMLGPKSKHSKEEVKLLKSMGIPEWLLQPTVVSPKDSCGLDKAGLSSHLIERCQDVGLSSLFAGSVFGLGQRDQIRSND